MTVLMLHGPGNVGVEFDETELLNLTVELVRPLVIVRETGEPVEVADDGRWVLAPYGAGDPSLTEDQQFLFRVHEPGKTEPLYFIELWVTWAGFEHASWANAEWYVEVRFAGVFTTMRLPTFTWEPLTRYSPEDAERVRAAMSVLDPDPEPVERYSREEVV